MHIPASTPATIAAGTTTVVIGSGYLTFAKAGAGATVTVYDNTAGSGTILWIGGATESNAFTHPVAFNTGLTVVASGGSGYVHYSLGA